MSSPLYRLLCRILGHRPLEAETKAAGRDYLSRCGRCGRRIQKKRFSNRWETLQDRRAYEREKSREFSRVQKSFSLKCLLGSHHRSRSRVRHDGLDTVSVCKRCNAPMKKVNGRWRAART